MAKRRRQRARKSRRRSHLTFWILSLTVVLAIAAVYVAWLDREVRTAFEGKRWALPARVYAQPLDLYTGAELGREDLLRELEALGYSRGREADEPGEYAASETRISVHTRPFRFWDGEEPSRRLLIRFQGGRIVELSDIGGRAVPLVRLQPQVIGKIYPEHHEDRILIRFEEAPQTLIEALIAVEDHNFYSHHGIDPYAIARAAWANLRAGAIVQGGSTLTQQLVKNFYLTHERSWWRKFNEAVMALLLEAHYSKQEILEAYLNEVYLGQHGGTAIHGFGLASEFYFRRPLKELGTEQLALLVGLVRGASYYNPRRHPQRALARRNLVLDQMVARGFLAAARAGELKQTPLKISPVPGWTADRYPAFIDLVRRQLHRDYDSEDLRTEGLRIFTTLDPVRQHMARQALNRRLEELEKHNPRSSELQGTVIIASVDTGEVTALIGQRGETAFGFNRALDAARPIGSLVKPFVYLTALAQPERYNVLTPLSDMPVSLPQRNGGAWQPQNYDRELHGQVPMYLALAHSYNLATVNLGLELGLDRVAATLEATLPGLSVPHYPSLLLGAIDLSPIQVTQMYQTLAGGGFRTPLKSILAVLDQHGEPLSRYPLAVDQVLPSAATYLTTFLMTQVLERGTARSAAARLPASLPLAGKTGTTDDLRDSWFAGFGSDTLAVVWIGRDDNKPTGLTGASGALRVWTDIMAGIGPQPLSLSPPEDVRWQKVLNGQRTDENCARASAFPFIQPYLPQGYQPCREWEFYPDRLRDRLREQAPERRPETSPFRPRL